MSSRPLLLLLAAAAAFPLAAFEIAPRIVPVGREVTVEIRAVNDEEKTAIAGSPLYRLSDQGTWSDGSNPRSAEKDDWRLQWEPVKEAQRGDGVLRCRAKFPSEGEQIFRFGTLNGKSVFVKGYRDVTVYALRDDLYALRPFKGDIHMHSIRCGHAKLEPKVIPAHSRRVGLDFMGLSEHWQVAPSYEAIAAAKPWKCGMELYPAEEIHTPSALLHSVAIGHRESACVWRVNHMKEFAALVDEEMKNPIYRPYRLNAFELRQAAMTTLIYRKTREFGAKLIVYSHPSGYNRPNRQDDPSENFRNFMFEKGDWDALELPNSATTAYNPNTRRNDRLMLMNSFVMELIAKGRRPGIVAASDCHDQKAAFFGQVYTVIFAKACDIDSFVDAVKNHRSLGLQFPNTPRYICFGPSRLMKFQFFLERYYWPGHDKLCKKQSELLFKLLDGDTSVQGEVEKLAAEIDACREKFYAPVK